MAYGIRSSKLRGRRQERETLDRMLRDARDGQSRVLVLRGEAGCGKTALLDHLTERASFARVLRAAGVESESEIAYSTLQQLCAPLLGHLDALPAPQREALATAFGLVAGRTPEPLLIGLAVLGLFAEAAAEQPLVCMVDDVQWADAMSTAILTFVARRLSVEAVALFFAARSPGDDRILAGLPEMQVPGLPDADARALLDAVLTGPVDAHVRDRIVAETRGNPLALLELPRGLSPAELAFGFGGHITTPLASRVEEGFQRRIAVLPEQTRTLLLAAAVEPVGDVPLLWRALELLGVEPEAAAAAEHEGLIEFDVRVRFPHPLVRSAAWRSGRAAELRAVHAALAEATDHARDPDRRAWHRAHAALGPDEEIAAELEGSARRAQSRGGCAAAAAFLERAAELAPDPGNRSELLVSAAHARIEAGSYGRGLDLLGAAETGPLDPLRQARAERLRAQVAYALNPGSGSVPALLAAARGLDELDPVAARDTLLTTMSAAMYAGRFGDDTLRLAAEAARSRASAGQAFPDLLLAGVVSWVLDGRSAAVPLLCRALDAMVPAGDVGPVWPAAAVAYEMFRLDLAFRMNQEAVRFALGNGALSLLSSALDNWANSLVDAGRFAEAADLMDEIDAVTAATDGSADQLSRLFLEAHRGPEQAAMHLIEARLNEGAALGNGRLHSVAHHALATLQNGLGNHRAAMTAAQEATAYPEMALGHWALRELVEAAARAGEPEVAAEARDRLAERTADTPTRAALGVQALADALAGPPEQAEDRYREAIDQLSAVETATHGCRARLLFGEWLARANRRTEARVELRAAYETFSTMGAPVFAARAARALAVTGEAVAERPAGAGEHLTRQEAAIVRLAIAGQTNPEIASALFLSPRTIEWHLRKVFTKLGIGSRRELAAALRDR
ncbi:ATP-binding protein [Paractinoplanes maris]|uniref:ATP-binding protein n=1 Tax=Paractinoplanes maris TaxID=1734446 RepID=UPI0027E20814|nr:AAA family ATPase [Actinoplanes maris]